MQRTGAIYAQFVGMKENVYFKRCGSVYFCVFETIRYELNTIIVLYNIARIYNDIGGVTRTIFVSYSVRIKQRIRNCNIL